MTDQSIGKITHQLDERHGRTGVLAGEHAPVEDRLTDLACAFQDKAWEPANVPEDAPVEQVAALAKKRIAELHQFLRNHAYSLSEFAFQVQDEYVRLTDRDEDALSVAQGIAIARYLRTMRKDESYTIRLDPLSHHGMVEVVHNTERKMCGITREGRIHT